MKGSATVLVCNFPVGLPPQEKTPASLLPNSIFPSVLLRVLWVAGVFFWGCETNKKIVSSGGLTPCVRAHYLFGYIYLFIYLIVGVSQG